MNREEPCIKRGSFSLNRDCYYIEGGVSGNASPLTGVWAGYRIDFFLAEGWPVALQNR